MPDVRFDRYYRYEELASLMQAFATEYPELVSIESIGKSYEGRDIWVATVTNHRTGSAHDKPAYWVDGNIHASEVSASSACIYLLNRLATQYGSDDDVTRVLDTRAFYICPRVNPDGAEWALADKPKIIRSGTRSWPYDEDPLEGLVQEDIDGDGRMLTMRIEDPNGPWKTHPDEPRLMVRRDPAEVSGTYYRVMFEGPVKNYDGIAFELIPRKQGLDFNRNFPANWKVEGDQPGAGPYPTSEAEVRAVVDFISTHQNVTGGTFFHTWSGVLLRPYSGQPDEAFAAEDLWIYQQVGEKGTDITGYPNVSVFHDFKYHPKKVFSGDAMEWMFDQNGLFNWTVEIWSPQRQAGLTPKHAVDWYRKHAVEDDIALLKWSDEKLDGKGYIDWYVFDHPQLGHVELGGWDMLYCWRNPPPHLLEAEIAPFSDWLIWQLLISPKLESHELRVTPSGNGTYHVKLTVQNSGWLPTYITKKAVEKKLVRGVVFEIDLTADSEILVGKERMVEGQLEGRSSHATAVTPWALFRQPLHADRMSAEWIVKAPTGSTATVTARHDRAGVVRETVTFGS